MNTGISWGYCMFSFRPPQKVNLEIKKNTVHIKVMFTLYSGLLSVQ